MAAVGLASEPVWQSSTTAKNLPFEIATVLTFHYWKLYKGQ